MQLLHMYILTSATDAYYHEIVCVFLLGIELLWILEDTLNQENPNLLLGHSVWSHILY